MRQSLSNLSKKILLLLALCLVGGTVAYALVSADKEQDWQQKQKATPIYQSIKKEREDYLKKLVNARGLKYPLQGMYIRVFKSLQEAELWGRDNASAPYTRILTFNIPNMTGGMGQKTVANDGYIPEGVYSIVGVDTAAPRGLALKLDWPNRSDKMRANNDSLAGNIYIQGSRAEAGNISIGELQIRDLYLLMIDSWKASEGNIPVHIFPFKMNAEEMKLARKTYDKQPNDILFWEMLQPIYQKFEDTRKLPIIAIDKKGRYMVN